MSGKPYTPRRVILVYLLTTGLFTLAASLIWAINTIFLIQKGGLDLYQVMLVNTAFLIAQMVCEVPTGVIADTIGRKASYLLSISTIIVSTLLYVLTPILGWGIAGFVVASVIIGLGFTFQTGAVDAWLVDALDEAGWTEPKERVFAWGQMAMAAAMIGGSLLGGFLGQVNLYAPYVVRAAILVVAFFTVLFLVHDSGFTPRPLHLSTFGTEAKTVMSVGVRYGWGSPIVRPLMFVSLVGGVAGMFTFYSWQPYVLDLLGRPDAVWLLGVVQAVASLAGIGGNMLVRVVMRSGDESPRPRARSGDRLRALGARNRRNRTGRPRQAAAGAASRRARRRPVDRLECRLRAAGAGALELHQRAHPISAAGDGALARLAVRRRRRCGRAAGARLAGDAVQHRARVAGGLGVLRCRCAALCDRRKGGACRGRRHGRECPERCVTSYLNGNEHYKYQLLPRGS